MWRCEAITSGRGGVAKEEAWSAKKGTHSRGEPSEIEEVLDSTKVGAWSGVAWI